MSDFTKEAQADHKKYQNICLSCISEGKVLHGNIDQTLIKLNSLHSLLNCGIGGSDCHVITTEYIYPVSIAYTYNTYFVMHWSM